MILFLLQLALGLLILGAATGLVYWGMTKVHTALECDGKIKGAIAAARAEEILAVGSLKAARHEASVLELRAAMQEVSGECNN